MAAAMAFSLLAGCGASEGTSPDAAGSSAAAESSSAEDSGNVLRRCVGFAHTYIGKNMEFSDKIVASGRIIDPVSEASVDLEEAGI